MNIINRTVSVILPIRNVADQIRGCLKKIECHLPRITSGAFEVIVVDDASNDHTLVVLDDMRFRFPFVRVILHASERGLDEAAATGLSAASGELLLIQEAGQMVEMDQLRQIARLATDPDLVAARIEVGSYSDTTSRSLQIISRVALKRIATSPLGSMRLVGATNSHGEPLQERRDLIRAA